MSRRVRTAAVAAVALVLSVLAPAAAAPAVVLAPTALTATAVSGWTTTAVSMKLGGELSRAVTVKPAAARTVLVQARKGLAGTVSTRSTLTTNMSGQVTARFAPPSTGTWFVRLAVKANATYAGTTTAWRKVTVSGTAGSTTAATLTVSPSSVLVGSSQKVSTTVKPAGVRTVEIWAKAPGSSSYAKRGTVTSSSTGAASYTWTAPTAGAWTYRVYVRPSLTLKGAWSSTRGAAVTALPGAVTGLQAVATDTSVTLTWTNPSQYAASIAVRRSDNAQPAPVSLDQGTAVPLATALATSVVDSGLADLTEYRYTVFALDAQGRPGPGASVTATTSDTPPAAATGASVDVSQSTSQATISWTNPPVDAGRVVVRRSLASEPAPESAFEGTEVPIDDAVQPASTVTDTGLEAGTAYRWTIIVVNDTGVPSTPTHVTATTMGGSFSWTSAGAQVPLQGGLTSLDCSSSTSCIAGDTFGYVMTYDGSTWTAPAKLPGSPGYVSGISCPFGNFCLAVTLDGKASVRTDGAWSQPVSVSGSALQGVSCAPGSTTCVAVGSQAYFVTTNGVDWTSAQFVNASLLDVDCASSLYCSMVGSGGKTYSLANLSVLTADATVTDAQVNAVDCVQDTTTCFYVASGGKAWKTGDVATTALGGGGDLTDISCTSTTSCFAVDYQGHVMRYSSGWAAASKPLGNLQLVAIACPDAVCIALDTSLSKVGRWNGSAWSVGAPIDPYTAVTRVSCASATFCVAGDQAGRVSQWNGSSWSEGVQLGQVYAVMAVDCVSPSLCVAANSIGEVFRWDGSTWSMGLDFNGAAVRTVDCASSSWCIAMATNDTYSVWTGSGWTHPAAVGVGADFVDISCPTASFCMALTFTGQWIRYVDGTWDASLSSVPGPNLSSVECTSSAFCVALDSANDVLRWDSGSGTWGAPTSIAASHEPYWLSCPTETSCTGLALQQLTSYVWSGAEWVAGGSSTPAGPIAWFSCSSTRSCVAVDAFNNTYIGTR